MNISESIFSNTKTYESIAEKRALGFTEIERALDIVLKFIISKKRLIYGGMCLDISLKITGHPGIYSNDAIPDYDFMSPDFYNDSNELALILQKENLANVSAINASHFNSRRVRVNFVPVADISYVPENIYNNIPFITHNNLRIVHPDFQRMDLHRSFNIPYSNPPQEVILHRLLKDQKRFRLINAQYPIYISKVEQNKVTKDKTKKIELDKKYLQNTAIGGIFGYAILYKFLLNIIQESVLVKYIKKTGLTEYINEKLLEIINVSVEISDKKITIETPENLDMDEINIITCNFQESLEKISMENKSKPEYYNKYLDNLRPRTIRVGNYEIFDTNGELIPCYNLYKTVNTIQTINTEKIDISNENNQNIYLVQPNYLLLYFLQKSFEFTDKKNIYQNIYQSIINIVEIAEKIVLATEENEPELLASIYKYLPFFLSVYTYGENNWSTDYIASIKDKKYFLSEISIEKREILRPPFGYYPDKSDVWPLFNINSSKLFELDGLKKEKPFEPINFELQS